MQVGICQPYDGYMWLLSLYCDAHPIMGVRPGQFILRVTANHRPEMLEMTNDDSSVAIEMKNQDRSCQILQLSSSFELYQVNKSDPFVVGKELHGSCTGAAQDDFKQRFIYFKSSKR